ncbi:hypothetical protein K439DRAFT_1514856 [Ramaria rubella]|nr:hypothetical protein K439DRAFT_1514856 [Ramaria rubella]
MLNTMMACMVHHVSLESCGCLTCHAAQRGGLLSDVFLHLVPHSFLSESEGVKAKLVLVEEKRNILIGLGPLSCIGLAAFFMSNGEINGCLVCHSHSHSTWPPRARNTARNDRLLDLGAATIPGRRPDGPCGLQRKAHEHSFEHIMCVDTEPSCKVENMKKISGE